MRVEDDFAAHLSSSLSKVHLSSSLSKVLYNMLSLCYNRSRAFILQRSSLMTRIAIGDGLPVEFEANGNKYNNYYYQSDGIYPK
jgi:hypothetical protein